MAQIPIRSVSEVTTIIKDRLDDMPTFIVEGEVSNLRPPNASGHLYFSLSDSAAKLNAAFFVYRQRAQGQVPKFDNGDKIRATGRISLYAPNGSYHLNIERLELCDSTGELLLRFEQLKKQLIAEGLCDPARKRPLPLLPKRIGIVTAPTGAAIRDILNILNRRFPNLHIIISPCRVQGPEAAAEIAAAIQLLNQHFAPGVSDEPMDAMIVGRGGGSLEDLWCFNEECVARAVANSKIPVISAVGHEPDIAITDFVADVRAPTPSAAAELICGRKEDIERSLSDRKERLIKAMRVHFLEARAHLRECEASPLLQDPTQLLERHAQSLDAREDRLQFAIDRALSTHRQCLTVRQHALEQHGSDVFRRAKEHLQTLTHRFDIALEQALKAASNRLIHHTATLKALDPTAVLQRGYALVSTADGAIVSDAATVQAGDSLTIRLAKGELSATANGATPPKAPPKKRTKARPKPQASAE